MTDTRAAVVTGAGSGIGAGIVTHLATIGWEVFAVARSADQLDDLGRLSNVHPVRADVRSDADIAEVLDIVSAGHERLDALINSAGILVAGTIAATPMKVWESAIETNFLGTLRVTQALLPRLRHPAGRIVTISSVAVTAPVSPQGPYAASKAALEVALETLAQELVPVGARVTVVQPGVVATPMHRSLPEGANTLDGDALRLGLRLAAFVKSQLRRATTVDEVVQSVVGILAHPDPPFRVTVGTDAAALAHHRAISDHRDWVRWWGGSDDADWLAQFPARTGLAAPPVR